MKINNILIPLFIGSVLFTSCKKETTNKEVNNDELVKLESKKLNNWFQENFDIVDLQELQRRIVSGFNDRPTLSITFDDGYAENCEFAMPMLVERRIPVTYFVTTFHTTEQQPFAHDVERETPLAANTIESLRALDLAGVEIAGHSRNHLDLGKISCEKTLVDEVLTASQEMEDLIGRKLRYFAFPFGQARVIGARPADALKQAIGDFGRQTAVAREHGPQARSEFIGVGGLQQIAGCTCPQGILDEMHPIVL